MVERKSTVTSSYLSTSQNIVVLHQSEGEGEGKSEHLWSRNVQLALHLYTQASACANKALRGNVVQAPFIGPRQSNRMKLMLLTHG